MENDLKKRAVSSLAWRFMERCGAQVMSFVVSVVLARLLEPSLYGSIALVTATTSILQVFVDSGMAHALIQKKDTDDLDYSSVFFFKEKEEPKNAFCISNPHIVLSCFKPSYDGKGFVIRIYNSTNAPQKCSINLPACFQKATQCNGLEDEKEETNLNDLHFKAFEIKTILLS